MVASDSNQRTRPSLLGRLAHIPADPDAWAEFAARYGRQVYRWCRRWHVQPADAEDISQAVLLEFARQVQTFRYDPAGSFRAWLKTLTHRAWCDWLAARTRGGPTFNIAWDVLASTESRDDLVARLEAEHRREQFEAAAAVVRLRVEPRTWEAFRLVAIEGVSGAEAAARLDLSVGAVYVARSKVQKLLREEAQKFHSDV